MNPTQTIPPEEPATAPRVSFFTFGCRLNQHDTAAMRARLGAGGFREASPGEPGDVVVVNTCTVTRRADQEARQLVRRLAAERPGVPIVVTGCYAQRAPEEVAGLPGVRAVLGIAERETIAAAALALARGDAAAAPIAVGPARERRPFERATPLAFGRTRALLKVQDGCDAFCAYCVVPYVRGRSRSLPLAEVVAQARRLLDAGFAEIVVTGADLGAYGRDLGERDLLTRLVGALVELGDRHRVRISSLEPIYLSETLVSWLGSESRLCRHLHLPLQSGSAAVLRAMRRPYTPRDYAALLGRVAARGRVAVGADVIVGFPGEGAAEFEETERFLEALPITYLHVFRYSPRPGTAASRSPGGPPDPVAARERSERLRALGDRKRAAFHRSLVGATLPAIVEGSLARGRLVAMTDLYAPVALREAPRERGIVPIRVEEAVGDRLVGVASG
ncbi:MAG TPA: tRNA (N(6)-L-threonylcarbamoyladenosine(37)-C(2))-methylthiotransferase MtaB [Candidatus Eisenbacteria bacterium]